MEGVVLESVECEYKMTKIKLCSNQDPTMSMVRGFGKKSVLMGSCFIVKDDNKYSTHSNWVWSFNFNTLIHELKTWWESGLVLGRIRAIPSDYGSGDCKLNWVKGLRRNLSRIELLKEAKWIKQRHMEGLDRKYRLNERGLMYRPEVLKQRITTKATKIKRYEERN